MVLLNPLIGLLALQLVSAAPQASPTPSALSTSSPSGSSLSTSLSTGEVDELFSLHEKLVNIPSISGDEVECAEFVTDYLTNLGYYVEQVPVGDTGTYNIFAYPQELKDQGAWPEVLITSHIDTVPPFYPFKRIEENGTIYHSGRGTVDAKGPVATMIIASHKFLQSRNETTKLGMLFVVSEETGGAGMKAFAQYASNTTFRAGIFGEPTEGKLASGHKGSFSVTLKAVGKASHSAYPWLGVSAINYIVDAIYALNTLEPALPKSELLGATTLNTGLIAGGVAGNVVPANANATVVIRVARSEDDAADVVKEMVSGMLSPIASRAKEANATFEITYSGAASVAQILDTDIEGLEVAPVFYGTDVPSLPQVEKRYLFGTGTIEVAHTPDEMLSQDELVQAADAYGLILQSLFAE
ncbi:acetyl-lysine deacetylase [Curvularia clavata]|uniref:Acetyl-lysine deacetylase n=1 Tax=Curvularia clavata TaxID=95742 RepID=A0A9Q8Z270_CURCL|nr:acetyl-lysine deacetylase [Curvularia clavata]